ncbi:MAG: hypothetical protein ACRD29_24710 [Acidimicrobiales bacterium]
MEVVDRTDLGDTMDINVNWLRSAPSMGHQRDEFERSTPEPRIGGQR